MKDKLTIDASDRAHAWSATVDMPAFDEVASADDVVTFRLTLASGVRGGARQVVFSYDPHVSRQEGAIWVGGQRRAFGLLDATSHDVTWTGGHRELVPEFAPILDALLEIYGQRLAPGAYVWAGPSYRHAHAPTPRR